MSRIKEALRWEKMKARVHNFFLVKDGGKDVLRKTRVLLCAASVILVGVCVTLFFGGQDDTSFFGKTDKPLSAEDDQTPATPSATEGKVGSLLRNSENRGTGEARRRPSGGGGIKVNCRTLFKKIEGFFLLVILMALPFALVYRNWAHLSLLQWAFPSVRSVKLILTNVNGFWKP